MLWSIAVFAVAGRDVGQRWIAAAGMLGSAAAVAIAILPATICLGATLPAIGDAVAYHLREARGRERGSPARAVVDRAEVLGAVAGNRGPFVGPRRGEHPTHRSAVTGGRDRRHSTHAHLAARVPSAVVIEVEAHGVDFARRER